MSILTINTDFEKLWGEPAPTIEFDLLKYQMFTFYGTEQTCEFSIIDNNENDITDLCEIIFNNNYVHLNEDGDEFVVDSDTSVGNFTTTAVAIYKYKTATITTNTEIETTVEELPRISFTEARYNIETDEGTEDSISFVILNNKNQDVTKDCSISFNNNYVHLNEDGDEFVVGDDVSAGEYTTIATATYQYKTAIVTATATISTVIENKDFSNEYLTFEAIEATTIGFKMNFLNDQITSVHYSVDNGETWNEVDITLSTTTITTLLAGEKIQFKGIATLYRADQRFTTTGKINIYGNIMSMLYGDNFSDKTLISNQRALSNMFSGTKCVSAEYLILPATTLADYCYYAMFYNCSNLTTAPVLPATTLATGCYNSMFLSCTKLNYIKAMFTTEPGSNYTSNWVYGVAATGTYVKNALAYYTTTGENGIPSGWTVETASE